MPPKKTSSNVPIYQIKVTLKGLRPPIWRRILVRSDTTLGRLHSILRRSMGWTGAHLHQFAAGRTRLGGPKPDHGQAVYEERWVKLNQIVTRGGLRFRYEYDFGDGWLHDLLVEKVLPPEPDQQYPVCLKGRRACPPEDVGGIRGYAGFLEAIRNPDHPEHKHYLEWTGGEFDPEYFDLDRVNQVLRFL